MAFLSTLTTIGTEVVDRAMGVSENYSARGQETECEVLLYCTILNLGKFVWLKIEHMLVQPQA
jgi:hypothetical protein